MLKSEKKIAMISLTARKYNQIWNLIHRLEAELLKKKMTIIELDKIRGECLPRE